MSLNYTISINNFDIAFRTVSMRSFGKNSLLSYRLPANSKIDIKIDKIFPKGFSEMPSTDLVDSLEVENHDFKMSLSCSSNTLVDLYSQHLGHFAVAVDGKFINHESLIKNMLTKNQIVSKMSGEEVMSNIFLNDAENEMSWCQLLRKLLTNYPGGYSVIILTKNKIYAARDNYGIKPLVLGNVSESTSVVEYDVEDGKPVVKPKSPNVIASDTVLLNKMNAKYIRQILPGEIIELSGVGIKSLGICYRNSGDSSTLCSMEYVLLGKPSSLLEEQRVYGVQLRLGEALGNNHIVQTDIVTTLPNISLAFLLGFANVNHVRIVEAFYYVSTVSDDSELNIYSEIVIEKTVTLVVDSPMNSCLKLAVVLLKKSGAREVHLRFCSPIVAMACPFGIELDSNSDLPSDINSVQYLKLEEFSRAVSKGIEGREIRNVDHCFHCFGGKHSMLKNL